MCVEQAMYCVSLTDRKYEPPSPIEIWALPLPEAKRLWMIRQLTHWVYRHHGAMQNLLNATPNHLKRVVTDAWNEDLAQAELQKSELAVHA